MAPHKYRRASVLGANWHLEKEYGRIMWRGSVLTNSISLFLHLLCVKKDANRFPNSHNAHQEGFWEPISQRQFIVFGFKVQMGMRCCSFAM
jgi:hypothetical protein